MLDKNDEILSIYSQLVYTVDAQILINSLPDCWLICQKVFSLINCRVDEFSGLSRIKIIRKNRSMFLIKISNFDALLALLCRVVNNMFTGYLTELSLFYCPKCVVQAVQRFVENISLGVEIADVVCDFFNNSLAFRILVLLYGFFIKGVFFHILADKRWLVEYRLD